MGIVHAVEERAIRFRQIADGTSEKAKPNHTSFAHSHVRQQSRETDSLRLRIPFEGALPWCRLRRFRWSEGSRARLLRLVDDAGGRTLRFALPIDLPRRVVRRCRLGQIVWCGNRWSLRDRDVNGVQRWRDIALNWGRGSMKKSVGRGADISAGSSGWRARMNSHTNITCPMRTSAMATVSLGIDRSLARIISSARSTIRLSNLWPVPLTVHDAQHSSCNRLPANPYERSDAVYGFTEWPERADSRYDSRTRRNERKVTRQAARIAYNNDCESRLVLTLWAVPLFLLLRPARRAARQNLR